MWTRRWRELRAGEGGLDEVWDASWPLVVSMVSYTMMSLADTLVMGWLGKAELAAGGLAMTLFFLVNSLFMGTLHGVKVLVSQLIGAQDERGALWAAWCGVALGVPFGLFVASLGWWSAELVALMGGSSQVQAFAAEYFAIRVLASPVWYVFVVLCDYYQGRGDMKTSMRMNLLINLLNIPLDVLFVFGIGSFAGLGVGGAAWASVLAIVIGGAWLAVRFVRESGLPRQGGPSETLRRIVELGAPMGVRYVLDMSGFALFTSMIADIGDDELAAHQIVIRVLSVSFLPGYAISEAACVLVGQYTGAQRVGAVRRVFWSAMWLGVSLMGAMGVVFWLFAEPIVGMFQRDEAVMSVAVSLLYMAALFQVFDAMAMVAMGSLNGQGQTRYTMVMSIAAAWCVMVPLGWLFGVWCGWGALGAWLGITVQIVFLAWVMCARFLRSDAR